MAFLGPARGNDRFPNQQVGLILLNYVLKEGRDAFDLFDLGAVRRFPTPIAAGASRIMAAGQCRRWGKQGTLICRRIYGGPPRFFQFAEKTGKIGGDDLPPGCSPSTRPDLPTACRPLTTQRPAGRATIGREPVQKHGFRSLRDRRKCS